MDDILSKYEQPEPVGDEMTEPKFGIGSPTWPGLAKLAEECGELIQVIGKILAYPQTRQHPDGTDTINSLQEEMGDVRAAIMFAINANRLDEGFIAYRFDYKMDRFTYWHDRIRRQAGA